MPLDAARALRERSVKALLRLYEGSIHAYLGEEHMKHLLLQRRNRALIGRNRALIVRNRALIAT